MTQHYNAEFMAKGNDKYISYLLKRHKSCRKGQAPTAITCFAFGEDKALCVLETLKGYIHR